MKCRMYVWIALAALLAESPPAARAAEAGEEQNLIQVLQSGASLTRKDAACARLKIIGTARCVPALSALLTDENLSHSARYALEPMATPEAGAALLNALSKTTGLLRVGILNSLAARRETQSVPSLAPILADSDTLNASASAAALGQIGGPDALKALQEAVRNSSGSVHTAIVDGLLRCANTLLISGERGSALGVFEELFVGEKEDSVRLAAFRGRILASGDTGLGLMLQALTGPADASQEAALQLVRDLQVPDTTKQLSNLLPALKPAVQIALIEGLAQRGDPAAVPALISLADGASPDVRLPIIRALDSLGDESAVPLLAGLAASGTAVEQKSARQALADLRRGKVTEALVGQLSAAAPEVQSELARALGARGDKTAVPQLLALVQQGAGPARKGSLQALSLLVDDSQLGALVDFVLQAKDPAARAEAAEALNAAYQRIQAEHGHADAAPLVKGFENGSNEARAALLPICGGLADPKIRAALRVALHDPNPQVHVAAVRALSDTTDPELLGDLLALAGSTHEDGFRTLAIGGGVRLVTQEETVKISTAQRIAALKSFLADATRPEQKRMALAGLGEVADVEALGVVETAFADSAVGNEAARAAVKIASALPGSQAQPCEAILQKALAVAGDDATRQAVQAALHQIQDNSDYITDWQVAGPYQQADKDFSALFDIVFPPEAKDSPGVKWLPLPAGADPKRPAVMDLFKLLGGQQCVAYARTRIHCDQEQNAVLELGSDDGVKVWLNDRQVYALNVARPLQPGSDKVNVTLHSGWNPLLLKITQNNQGWEFCVRVRKPDGSHLDGLRCESAPKTATAAP